MRSVAPAVSVIIPAYNAAAVISDQLSALARQKVDFAWEVLVCDNGSTDATVSIAQAWSDRVPLRIVDASARRGAAAARNIGAAHARAPMLAFCDADDVVADDWLRTVVRALSSADYVVVGARSEAAHSTRRRPVFDVETTLVMAYLPQLPFGGAGHSALRAAAFHDVGGFDESFRIGEDVDFSWRMQLAGYRLTECPAATITISRRSGTLATVKQYYRYAQAARQLEHKYAPVIAAFAAADLYPTTSCSEPEGGGEGAAASRRLIARFAAHLRTPVDFGQFVARTFQRLRLGLPEKVGYALGLRFGRVDRSMPTVAAGGVAGYIRDNLM